MTKRIAVSVMSDFITDQRVQRECGFLHAKGYHITVFCLKPAVELKGDWPYEIRPVSLPVKKGIWFFLLFNLLAFFRLLRFRPDVYWANDLDTLLPNVLLARARGKKIIYDSHEYYTQQPQLVKRRLKQWIWEKVEAYCIPRVSTFITVNESIADLYALQYHRDVQVLMNMPLLKITSSVAALPDFFPGRKKLILQGSGIHHGRGGMEAAAAMGLLSEEFLLIVVGSGDAVADMKSFAGSHSLENRILFFPRMPYREMLRYTRSCDLGLHLDDVRKSGSGMYSSPNKLFDYLHAGIPVLATRGAEITKLLDRHELGYYLEDVSPECIAEAITTVFKDEPGRKRRAGNAMRLREEYCWEKQEEILEEVCRELEK